ncbi:MAG TPA: methylmalonyl Co-A mutase-associated GTPase MeaB [Nitrospiraceae bacterium]|nr:methylmalonyl Co-A mutase-associated GTPase MeaB [Nitrospiraceae bacterium]
MDLDALTKRVIAGDVRAVSRLITLLENQDPSRHAALMRLDSIPARATVIGITGYPGAGKSTLVNQLVMAYRRQGHTVGVLAVDMSSPLTGGAILGDRIRMQDHALDNGVYIRSMATRGRHGGLAPATKEAVRVLDAAGYGIILVETIGVGQDDVEIRDTAQVVVAVVAPGLGDEIQAMKAGLLEMADLIVVNKGDREGADLTLLDLRECHPHVLRTVAPKSEGLPELLEAIAARRRS